MPRPSEALRRSFLTRANGSLLTMLGACVVGVACAAPPVDDGASSAGDAIQRGGSATGTRAAPRRTVCLTGAISHASPSNAGFRALCESPIVKGRIDDCGDGTCKSTFGTFPSTLPEHAWEAVFDVLDDNGDGVVDARDPEIELDVLGFSWGGVNAVALARLMSEDGRMFAPRKIARLVLLDAFQPLASYVVPRNVAATYSFRHSVAPETDCSLGALFGPYLGIAPRCARGQICFDHDYSLSPAETFGGIPGRYVGHCEVPQAAMANVAQILQGEPLAGAPRAVPVRR